MLLEHGAAPEARAALEQARPSVSPQPSLATLTPNPNPNTNPNPNPNPDPNPDPNPNSTPTPTPNPNSNPSPNPNPNPTPDPSPNPNPNPNPNQVERPVYAPDGRLRGVNAGWCQSSSGHSIITHLLGPRFYCVDMGGWAFDAALLRGFKGVPWSYPGRRPRGTKSNATVWRGGESEFLQQLLGPHAYPEDLQPLANCAHDVLVIHNAADVPKAQWRAHKFVRAARPVFCRTHGW